MEGGKSCPSGQILRKGYYARRKSSGKRYRVSPKCIKDRGLSGKGKRLFTLTPGALGKFGYSLKTSPSSRHKALQAAVKNKGYAEIMRRVNALSILMKNTEPDYYNKLISDKDYLQEYLGQYSKTYQRTGRKPSSRKRRKSSKKRRKSSKKRRKSSKKKRRKSPRRKSRR